MRSLSRPTAGTGGRRGGGGRGRFPVLVAASLLLLGWPPRLAAQAVTTTRVSVATDGTEANGQSSVAAISADGRYVLFNSGATTLVAGDTNGTWDAFLHDRRTGATTRVSVATGGVQANDHSGGTAISADGRFVAFSSIATNLVAADTNGAEDAFVHDRQVGTTARVSLAMGGGDPDGPSWTTAISADGRYVVIESRASNLVAGDSNGWPDVFVHDRQTGTTQRVSVATDGTQANAESEYSTIDPSGRYVGFCTRADTLTPGETFGLWDVYVHDRQTGATARVSATPTGSEPDGGSCPLVFSDEDARYVAFGSAATDIVAGDTKGYFDVFVRGRHVDGTTRVSVATGSVQGDDNSYMPAISATGRWVAFNAYATNLVANDTNGILDVFVVDQFKLGEPGSLTRASITTGGGQADEVSCQPVLSANGRYVAFTSWAANLVSADTNGTSDAFVHDRGPALDAPTSLVVGGTNTLTGANFTAGTEIMLFVATARGAETHGPYKPAAWTSTSLTWAIPSEVPLSNGFGTIQVINTDTDYWESNCVSALLEGDPTVMGKGETLTITGTGFVDPAVNGSRRRATSGRLRRCRAGRQRESK